MVIIISEKPAAFTFYSCPEVEALDPRYCYFEKDSTGSYETSVVAYRTARYHPRRPQAKMSKLISISFDTFSFNSLTA
jgi:hypothetical protein